MHVIRNGLSGKFKTDGVLYDSGMDEYPDMLTRESTAILNHMAPSRGNKWPTGMKPYSAAEVNALRGAPITHQQVLASRPKGWS